MCYPVLATDPMDLDPFHGNIWSNLPPQSPLPRGLSFPFAFLHLPFDLLSDPIKPSQLLQILPPRAPVSLIKRASRLVLHRIHGVLRSQSASATDNAVSEKIGDAISGCVSIVKQLLAKFDGKDVAGFDALKAEIITDPAMKELFVSELLPGSARQGMCAFHRLSILSLVLNGLIFFLLASSGDPCGFYLEPCV